MATDDNAAVGVPPARAKPSVGEWCQTPRARITSYNVCYTKLLRLSRRTVSWA
ncbi:hypothetical protein [Streptomyces cyaneogriseus]|uniref:hypothetical protein n=1 Tax=Streptomyces cyaneogriseus TaxID=68192 RepID=UPI001331262B|nr:hypothetical protein [Streptomyces cyaneogriseus]